MRGMKDSEKVTATRRTAVKSIKNQLKITQK
jgi:hypothetical protein